MSHRRASAPARLGILLLSLSAFAAAGACSASGGDPPPPQGTGGSAGATGTGGTGNTPGTGGATGNPGGASSTACTGSEHVDPATYPACSTCNGGRCVPKADYPTAPLAVLAECDPNTVCMPDDIVATKGAVQLAKCTSVLGMEGRCTSLCITVAQELSAVLPQDTCSANERCAPCFNPTDGSETGICRIGCDTGPTTQPVLFSKCCSGRGDCVPKSDLPPGAYSNSLKQIDCASADDACIPSAIVANPTFRFASCNSCVSALPGTPCAPYGPGACLPDCIVNATGFGDRIGPGTGCASGEKCAPCKDPGGKDTGACLPP